MSRGQQQSQLRLEDLIPHRAPRLLLDDVMTVDDLAATTVVNITSATRHFDSALDGVPAWIGIEYMAQTVSLWSGNRLLQNGQPIRIGFLLGTRRYYCEQSVFTNGSTLMVTATPRFLDGSGLSAFDCTIALKSASDACSPAPILASARINAYEPEHPELVLSQSH